MCRLVGKYRADRNQSDTSSPEVLDEEKTPPPPPPVSVAY